MYQIDFADCLCGDPLLDIGTVLYDLSGDLDIFRAFMQGYDVELNDQQRELIQFYSINQNLWILSRDQKPEEIKRLQDLLHKLLTLELKAL